MLRDVQQSVYRNKSPYLIQAQIFTDSGFRTQRHRCRPNAKPHSGKAPAYMYLWAFASPGFDGKFGAVHGTDVSATFNNYRDGIGGTGSQSSERCGRGSPHTWIAIAKNAAIRTTENSELARVRTAKRATMIFDKERSRGERSARRDAEILG